MTPDATKKIVQLNLGLAFAEGLFVLWQYIQTPSEAGAAVFLGFSFLRLAVLLSVLLASMVIGYLLISSWRVEWWGEKIGTILAHPDKRLATFGLLIAVIGLEYVLLFSSERALGKLAVYRTSLSPLLVWMALITLVALISFFALRVFELPVIQAYGNVLLPSVVLFFGLTLTILFIATTRIGLKPDAVYWQDAGTPLLLPQVWLSWCAGVLLFYFLNHFKTFSSKKADLLIGLGLWIFASFLWLNQPLTPAYNALEPKVPNFQIYPFGDALLYDVVAHGFLVGHPIQSDFWLKPLYSLLLAVLHLFSGENFELLVSIQVLLFAVIPVFVYLLVFELSNRPAGLVAAMLVILRERNGIALSNVIEVSHSKLLMSDVFCMGLIVLILWLTVRWIKAPSAHGSSPFIIGGLVALLTLTRGHPVVLFPVIGCVILFLAPRPIPRWKSIILLIMGFAIPLLPWFWRNYQDTGKLAFQNSISPYSAQMAGLYSMTPGVVASPKIFNETDTAYYERMQKQVAQFVIDHPNELIKFVSAHYAHNAVFSYIFLPHSFEIENVRSYVKTEPFWRNWTGDLSVQGWSLLVLNIIILAVGLGCAWKETGWYASIPLLIGIGYNMSVAVGRLSGWRFILPADWITLIYYAMGLMQIAYIVRYLLLGKTEAEKVKEENSLSIRSTGFLSSLTGFGALFLSISLLLTYGHKLFTPQDAPPTQEYLIQVFEKNSDLTQLLSNDIQKFMAQENAVILSGQALYPAFFKAKSGALNYYWLAFEAKPYSRIVFQLMGPQSEGVILPVTSRPSRFPAGVDVIVLGCRTENNFIDAISVLITGMSTPLAYNRDPMPSLTCPLSAPE